MAKFRFPADYFDNLTFVTDEAANMKKALNERKRFGCFAHVVSTGLKHTFDEQHLKEKLPEVYDTIQGAKALVTYMKHSGLQKVE